MSQGNQKPPKGKANPCHRPQIVKLNRVKGQIEGVSRMIESEQYCPHIIVQIRAAREALSKIEASVLKTHLHHCVKDAMQSNNLKQSSEKIDEVVEMFYRMNRKGSS